MTLQVTCDTCGQGLGNPACLECARYARPSPPTDRRTRPRPDRPERRRPTVQPVLPGGYRVTDPPLTTRACADWMGMTPEYVRQAIDAGELEAETLIVGKGARKRRVHRIHHDEFVAWLKRLGWKRLPPTPSPRSM